MIPPPAGPGEPEAIDPDVLADVRFGAWLALQMHERTPLTWIDVEIPLNAEKQEEPDEQC